MKYIFIAFIAVCAPAIIFTFAETLSEKIYSYLQNFYINKCNKENYTIYEKLLLANCKCYFRAECFCAFMNPIKYNYSSSSYFEFDVFSYNFRRTVKSIILYLIVAFAMQYIINNYTSIRNLYTNKIQIYLNFNALKNAMTFLFDNKWYILLFLSIIAILIGIYKNKFSNKILTKIQDDELKNIIDVNRKISKKLLTIEGLLRQNIKALLKERKSNGILIFLYLHAENKFDFCEYDYVDNKLKLRESYNNHSFRIKLNSISEQIAEINEYYNDYEKANNYFSPSFINKYINGLNHFDPKLFIKSSYTLASYERINEIIMEFINKCDISSTNKSTSSIEKNIEDLNDAVIIANKQINKTLIESIETIIKLNYYNKRFIKAIKFKKYREINFFAKLISNIK